MDRDGWLSVSIDFGSELTYLVYYGTKKCRFRVPMLAKGVLLFKGCFLSFRMLRKNLSLELQIFSLTT